MGASDVQKIINSSLKNEIIQSQIKKTWRSILNVSISMLRSGIYSTLLCLLTFILLIWPMFHRGEGGKGNKEISFVLKSILR